MNAAAVEAILAAVSVPCQLGGGIRDMATIEMWLAQGPGAGDPGHGRGRGARRWSAPRRGRFPGRVAVGIDARDGRVATRGWAEETEVTATDLAKSFEDAGVAAIIYTDIDRDGAMQGPNVAATEALARAVTIPVIASGGVAVAGRPGRG